MCCLLVVNRGEAEHGMRERGISMSSHKLSNSQGGFFLTLLTASSQMTLPFSIREFPPGDFQEWCDFRLDDYLVPQATYLSDLTHSIAGGVLLAGEQETINHPAPVRNFSLTKEWGPQRRDFGGRYGFCGCIGLASKPLFWIFLRKEKVSKLFPFGGCA